MPTVSADKSALQPFSGGDQFREKYAKCVAGHLHLAKVDREQQQDFDLELEKFKSNVSTNAFVQTSTSFSPVVTENGFSLCQLPLSDTTGVHWAPPIGQCVQDICFVFHLGVGSQLLIHDLAADQT